MNEIHDNIACTQMLLDVIYLQQNGFSEAAASLHTTITLREDSSSELLAAHAFTAQYLAGDMQIEEAYEQILSVS